jgi:hypothetical protein
MALLPATMGLVIDAWSGDGRRALVSAPVGDARSVTEIDLESGRASHELTVGIDASLGYSTPSGLAILVEEQGVVSWVDVDRAGLDPSVCLTSRAIRVAGVAMPADSGTEEPTGTPVERAVRSSVARCLAVMSGTRSSGRQSLGVPDGELSVLSFPAANAS